MAFSDLVADLNRTALEHLGGITVTYKPLVGGAVDVEGIFDERHVVLDPGEGGVEQIVPVVWLRLADLPTDPENDEPILTIDGKQYQVWKRQTDGVGGTVTLFLHRSDV